MSGDRPLLRAVQPETAALTPDEMQTRGDAAISAAKRAVVDATKASMQSDWFERGKKFSPATIRGLRERATRARKAWADVESILSELLNDYDRTRESHTRLVTEEVAPGHYVMKRVPTSSEVEA